MKNFFLLLALSLTTLACNKESDEPVSSATFSITGVQDADLTTNPTASASFLITITSNSGSAEDVSLYADNLPKGVFSSFTPSSGTTPFTSRVMFWNDFSGTGGIFPITVVGNGPSGSKSYKMNLTLDHYKGWKYGDSVYHQKGMVKDAGSATRYPNIKVYGGGAGILTISFGLGKKLPTVNKTYKITPFSGPTDDIQITMFDDPEIFSATGVGMPTGTFRFDSTGRFIFKCTGVEVSNGVQKKLLDVNVIE